MRRRLALAAVVAFAVACPAITGTVPDDWLVADAVVAVLAIVGVAVPLPRRLRPAAQRVTLVIVSTALTLAVADTMSRIALRLWLEPGPIELYGNPYPKMPLIGRYTANVRYRARIAGDLSRPSAFAADREVRDLVWITDAAGFRNDPALIDPARPLDLILLGDSFGDGADTSQEQVWATLFATRYRLNAYNLSMVAASPWHEYVTLASELDRLRVRRGTVVVWALFTGNDLDGGVFWPTVDLAQLPWRGALGQLRVEVQTFRDRSPVRRAQAELRDRKYKSTAVWRRSFVDGRSMLFLRPYVARAHATLEMVERHPNYAPLTTAFAATVTLARERGLTLAVVLIPSKEEVYAWVVDGAPPWSTTAEPSALSVAIGKMAATYDVAFLDLKPAFVTESRKVFEQSGALLWWRDDTHWNERGHELAARVVYERFVAVRSAR
jgi:hypothetical protein